VDCSRGDRILARRGIRVGSLALWIEVNGHSTAVDQHELQFAPIPRHRLHLEHISPRVDPSRRAVANQRDLERGLILRGAGGRSGVLGRRVVLHSTCSLFQRSWASGFCDQSDANGAVATSNGTVGMSNGTVGMSNGTVGMSNGAVGMSNGAVGMSNGAVGMSNGAVAMSNGAVAMSNGAVATSNS
jgi:hypothetical protein